MRPEWSLILPLVTGYAADLLLGDPPEWPHPGMLLTVTFCALAWAIPWYIAGLESMIGYKREPYRFFGRFAPGWMTWRTLFPPGSPPC
jgi:cobalamin biosynthesis protein CobD/CbiB